MKIPDKNNQNEPIDKDVEEQVHEEKNLNLKKMLLWVVGLVLFFSIIAWIGGFITVGGPDKGGRFGSLSPQDSSAVVKSDTVKAE
ncbi:hypothetical protein [Emticicia sp. TH156]|uniref:hypothetical protein n=1 Tax=Emticicia sp. TH156 TaxID=2067454 RepID=UPI000C78A21C|nr:hypothetical protein [Emticicia sp. TH156]PLK43755.1 hypothetical protein C0V77_14695 [Emticicia sp. TH156]